MESEESGYRKFLMRLQCGRDEINPDAIYRARFKLGFATKEELKKAAYEYFARLEVILVHETDNGKGIVARYPLAMELEYRRVLIGAMEALLGAKAESDHGLQTVYSLPSGMSMTEAMPVADMIHQDWPRES